MKLGKLSVNSKLGKVPALMEFSTMPPFFPEFKRTKIIAILKPRKDENYYHLIVILSLRYKLLESFTYNRIYTTICALIQVEWLDLGTDRPTDQILSLTIFTEAGFEKLEQTAVLTLPLHLIQFVEKA